MKFTNHIFLICLVLLLVGCGEKKSKDVDTPNVSIHTAIMMGDIETVDQHLKAGTDANHSEWTRESSPLITASIFGEVEIAKLLIENGADVNYQNEEGSTALVAASLTGQNGITNLLIQNGAKVNIQNNEGSTALIVASLLCYEDVVKSLLDNGADKEIKNKYNRSAVSVVTDPFTELEEVYKKLGSAMNMKFDLERIKETRPKIAELLK